MRSRQEPMSEMVVEVIGLPSPRSTPEPTSIKPQSTSVETRMKMRVSAVRTARSEETYSPMSGMRNTTMRAEETSAVMAVTR